jgi:hypothetical protein
MTNEASILLLFMSERELWRGGPEESSFFFQPGVQYFLKYFILCRLLSAGCQVLVVFVDYVCQW